MMAEKKKQDELLDEIDALKQKVANANEGLAAANRLGEQLEKKTQAISMLKHEVKLREDLLKKAQAELKETSTSNAAKVDRYLVKNLVVGYVNADAGKKPEVLKVIATVLDFNQEEREKTGLLGSQGWLTSWFGGGGAQSPSQAHIRTHKRASSAEVHEATGLDLSLAQAFVAFLQNESAVKAPPKTLIDKTVTGTPPPPDRSRSGSTPGAAGGETPSSINTSGRSTPTSAMPTLGVVNPNFSNANASSDRNSPSILNAPPMGSTQGLPTFSVNRSSSSILKQVLYEEKNS